MTHHSPEAMINQTSGPFLEVGGPTQHLTHPPSIDFSRISKHLLVSNVAPDYVREGYWVNRVHPSLGNYHGTERPTGMRRIMYRFAGEEPLEKDWQPVEHKLDIVADATALPVATGKLGALYASALQPRVEGSFINHEAPRTLEPGGILVAERVKKATVENGIPPYFDVIKSRRAGKGVLNLVLRRNDIPYPEHAETELGTTAKT